MNEMNITINGTTYTADEITRWRHEEGSFQASLSDFLNEWFSPSDTVKVHTSGSTGTPKELWVEKQRMVNSARMTTSFLGLRKGDTALLCMPLQYIAGKMVVVRSLVAELNLIPVAPCGHPLEHLDESPCFAAMIPMQVFNSLQVAEEREKLMKIRHLIIGGGFIDKNMEKELSRFPHNVWSTYGMTETLSHIALRRLNGKEASQWYTPFDNVSLHLTDKQTLAINAPLICPEPLETNDIAEFNEKGQFRILGRKDNIINTGGVKVQAEEIETALKQYLGCPFMITSAPDEKFGERIVLLVEGTDIPANAEDAFEKLPPYWRPKTTVCINRLPLTGSGKPDRATAKQLAAMKTS